MLLTESVEGDPRDRGRARPQIRGVDLELRPSRQRPLSPLGDDSLSLDEAAWVGEPRSGATFLTTVPGSMPQDAGDRRSGRSAPITDSMISTPNGTDDP